MISITPTYFGTEDPSSESLRTQRIPNPTPHLGLAILCVRRLPEVGTLVPKHVGFILIMNSVL